MKCSKLYSFLAIAFLAGAAACAETAPTEPTYLPDGDAERLEGRTFTPAELDEAVPGERPDATPRDGTASLADCVYVQYCNAPGDAGTVCRLRSGCTYNTTTVNECKADTNAVCGAPTYPWYLY